MVKQLQLPQEHAERNISPRVESSAKTTLACLSVVCCSWSISVEVVPEKRFVAIRKPLTDEIVPEYSQVRVDDRIASPKRGIETLIPDDAVLVGRGQSHANQSPDVLVNDSEFQPIEWRRTPIDWFQTVMANVPLHHLAVVEKASLHECFGENRAEHTHRSLLKVQKNRAT